MLGGGAYPGPACRRGILGVGPAQGLDTVVGHGGMDLTGEQIQHLALVRALLSDAGVVILDEATAEAGSASAALMERLAMRVAEGRTESLWRTGCPRPPRRIALW